MEIHWESLVDAMRKPHRHCCGRFEFLDSADVFIVELLESRMVLYYYKLMLEACIYISFIERYLSVYLGVINYSGFAIIAFVVH